MVDPTEQIPACPAAVGAPGTGSANRLHLPPGDQGIKAAIFFPRSQPDPPPRSIFGEGMDTGWIVPRLPWRDCGRHGAKVTARRPRSRTEASGRELISRSSGRSKELPSHGNTASASPAAHPTAGAGEAGSDAGGFPPGERHRGGGGGEPSALTAAAPAACGTLPAPGPAAAGPSPWRGVPASRRAGVTPTV